jgi:uncharacterized membrane protein YccC
MEKSWRKPVRRTKRKLTSEPMRAFLRLACAVSLSLAIVTATPLPVSVPSMAEPSCCAMMPKAPGDCVPQPGGMTGSRCNLQTCLQTCLQLFQQNADLNLEPDSSDFAWADFASRALPRKDQPPVPPPRA